MLEYEDAYLQNLVQHNDPGYILTESCPCQSGYTNVWRRGWTVGSRVSVIPCIDVNPFALLQHQMVSEIPVAETFPGKLEALLYHCLRMSF